MSINSALLDLRLPADRTATKREITVIAMIRRLVGRPRRPHGRPYLSISDSYRIPDRRREYEGGANWVHTHH